MERYDTKLDDGTLYVQWDDGWLELGSMATIRDLLGGDTYEIEYDDDQSKVPWLENELEDNTLTFDVTEAITDMDFNGDFVSELAEVSIDDTGRAGHPQRTAAFAEKMREIWDAQGQTADNDD
ncbi:hypothetical protein Hrd1104_09930 [Halorhabdus sp. CBA1104]|uniref:hypothetical protein n=1 Tax=unclassified Halorhabdus TaxID=2621901 RepID=UPI0012B2CFB4|nr:MULTISPECIES: hypothetical protein [unclassified Halorhabdus]QGN07588.1 hypothetical protein Hrd1104_09930 [Halorhabdus sp. CBA1104]